MVGVVLGSGFNLTTGTQFLGKELGITFSITIVFTTTLLAIIALTWLITRKRVHDDSLAPLGLPTLVRALVEGAILATLTTVVSAILAIFKPEELKGISASLGLIKGFKGLGGVEMTFSPRFVLLFFTILVVTSATIFAARSTVLGLTWRPSWYVYMRKELGQVALILAPFYLVIAAVILVWAAFSFHVPFAIFTGLTLLPTLALATMGLAFFGDLSITELEDLDFLGAAVLPSLKAWNLPYGFGYLLILMTILALCVVAIRVGLRRDRCTGIQWGRIWQLPVGLTAAWLILGMGLARLRFSTSLPSGSMSLSYGISAVTILTVALVSFGLSLLAEILPMFLATNAQGLLISVGGRAAVQRWANSWAAPTGAKSLGMPAAPTPVPPAPGLVTSQEAGAAVAPPPASAPPLTSPTSPVPPPLPPTPPAASSAPLVPPAAPAQRTPLPPPPVTAPATPMPGAPLNLTSAAKPMDPKKKRKLILIFSLIGALIALLIAGMVALSIINSGRTAEASVRDYIEAISRGDAEAANAIVDPGIDNEYRALLTNDVLAQATRPELIETKIEDEGKESTTVTATMSLDGKRFDHTFTVEPGEKEFGLLRTWKIKTPMLYTATIHTNGLPTVKVGGVALNEEHNEGRQVRVTAFPGKYPVESGNEYFEIENKSLLVLGGESYDASLSLHITASAKLTSLLLEAANTKLKACVTPPTNTDHDCPYAVQSTTLAKLELKDSFTSLQKFGVINNGQGYFTTSTGSIITSELNSSRGDEVRKYRVNGNFDLSDTSNPQIKLSQFDRAW